VRSAQVDGSAADEIAMIDAAGFDAAIASGVIAAAGAIGLLVRARHIAANPTTSDTDRQVFMTRAALKLTEHQLETARRGSADGTIDLRGDEEDLIELDAATIDLTTTDRAQRPTP
jgi:hypothetical protein